MPEQEINDIKSLLVKNLEPESIYLFGSFAKGTQTEDSDFDFYIVMPDGTTDLSDVLFRAHKAIRHIKQRPVDILAGTVGRFEERKKIPSMENEIYKTGVVIYER